MAHAQAEHRLRRIHMLAGIAAIAAWAAWLTCFGFPGSRGIQNVCLAAMLVFLVAHVFTFRRRAN